MCKKSIIYLEEFTITLKIVAATIKEVSDIIVAAHQQL